MQATIRPGYRPSLAEPWDGLQVGGRQLPLAGGDVFVYLLGPRRADNVRLFEVSGATALLSTLKAKGGNGFTVHGFRSSFSDWVIEQTSYGADLADMCIAHLTRGKVRAAYQRSPQLEKRRAILQEWSAFCTTGH